MAGFDEPVIHSFKPVVSESKKCESKLDRPWRRFNTGLVQGRLFNEFRTEPTVQSI